MKKTKRRGLSFLELVIAMTLTFLSISFLMGLFITSLRNSERSKKRTAASFMAQSTLERLSAFTADQIVPGNGNFSAPLQDYTYNVDVQPAGDYTGWGADPDLKQVICTVTDPAGNQSTLVALRQAATPLYGLVASRTDDNVVFSQDPVKYSSQPNPLVCNNTTNPIVLGGDQSAVNWYPSTVFLDTVGNPTMPNGGQVGAMCSSPDLGAFWAVDIVNRGIRPIASGATNWGSLCTPTGLGHPAGLTGRVGTGGSDRLWLGDDKNHCIWEYKQNTNSWNGPLAPPGMGRVASLASDDAASAIWVIDVSNKGLRKYDTASATWNPNVIAPPATLPRPGNLVGLAVSGDGKKVYACDEQNFYILDVSSLTWSVPPSVLSAGSMPCKLTSDIPQSLATNSDGTKVWASPVYGSLYYYDAVSDTWYENYIP